jgi:hypothetical protein
VADHLDEAPALEAAQGTCFCNRNAVADLSLVFLVMNMEFLHLFDDFSKKWMGNAGDGLDNDGFVHFVGNHFADAGLAEPAGFNCGRFGGGCCAVSFMAVAYKMCWMLEFYCATLSCTVFHRQHGFKPGNFTAQVRRRCGFSSWPACCCNRRWKISWRNSFLREEIQ